MNRNILFFDGVCGFCNHFVNWVMSKDPGGRIMFAPLQGTTATELVPEPYRLHLSTVVFLRNDVVWVRSAAICQILFCLGGVWALAGALLWIIPYPLRDLGYRAVGSVRYRLFGRRETCRMPTAEERARFLE